MRQEAWERRGPMPAPFGRGCCRCHHPGRIRSSGTRIRSSGSSRARSKRAWQARRACCNGATALTTTVRQETWERRGPMPAPFGRGCCRCHVCGHQGFDGRSSESSTQAARLGRGCGANV
ncbi:Permease of the drug/metabolite transporter (DMT) superfamily protein [Minicystis rosea]|nr:Permease of the drug/metabolite transporter (DMT) superfamily protein [Minicystis rosea]